jgi:alpha-L-rhamnosidase
MAIFNGARLRGTALFVLLAAGLFRPMTSAAASAPSAPVRLTTEHATEPLDVEVAAPRFSWQLGGDRGDVVQRAFQIAVASRPSGQGDVWDSGQVDSPAQTDVPYAGPTLASNATYYWAVRVWTTDGAPPGDWSRPARFETGLFSPAEWTATWIGRDNPATVPSLGAQPPAPLLRKEFTLERSIARARLRIVGLGFYVAYVNGRRVGDQVLDPPPTVFDVTALYATHDVTDALRRGRNAIGVTLGRGYFGAPLSADIFVPGKAPWRSEPRLLVQLDVTYRDGGIARIVSDGSWVMTDGPILDSLRVGEAYDARLEPSGWARPGFDAAGWTPAPEQPAPAANLRAMAMEPIRNVETLRPVGTSSPSPGVTVYDFGRTTAGWALISAKGDAGTTITLLYGETLNPDGTVARVGETHVDAYTLRGRGRETWEPSFTRHGFRFVQVSSTPAPTASFRVRARVNHTDLRSVGRFRSGSDLLNQLQANQRASLLANMWGFPTDTPWRDRMGWTADAWLYLDSAIFNFDVQRLYAQWLRTYRESQGVDGSLPVIVPSIPDALGGLAANDPSWSGTIVLDAWALYHHYGDVRLLADNYDAMVRWMNLMRTTVAGTGNVHRGFSFGDWASPGVEANGSPFLNPPEGPALTATADLYQEARTLARIAEVLDQPADAATYEAFADDVKAAFNATFFDAAADVYRTDVEAGYRQTSNLMPLAYGLVPTGHEDAVYRNLVADITSRGNHLNTGAIGTKQLLPVLTERGDVDLAYTIATQTTYPSWGYWVEQGATSSWETWSHTGLLQSENHAFLGAFDDWLYRHLAGIQATAPGYATVRIRPAVPAGLSNASAAIDTPRGEVASAWRRKGGKLVLTVTIPGNTSAEIHVPSAAKDQVTVKSDRPADPVRRDERYAVFATGSGTHVFEVRLNAASAS